MDKKKLDELGIAKKEIAFQNQEKKDRNAELVTAKKELAFHKKQKETNAAELVIAKKHLPSRTGRSGTAKLNW